MGTGPTNTTALTVQQTEFLSNLVLAESQPNRVHEMLFDKDDIPENNSGTIKWVTLKNLPVSTVELQEGVTPTPLKGEQSVTTASIQQHGEYVEITDKQLKINPIKVFTKFTQKVGDLAGQVRDQVIRDLIVGASTNDYYAGAVAGKTNVVTKIATADLDKIARMLRNANVKPFSQQINASTKIATQPIRPSYLCLIHPDMEYDVQALTGFIDSVNYSEQKVHPFEIGYYRNFRFVVSTNCYIEEDAGGTAVTNTLKYTTANTACDLYAMLIAGKEAGFVTKIGKEYEYIAKDLGAGDDPLNQRATTGYKMYVTAGITNQSNFVTYWAGVSE